MNEFRMTQMSGLITHKLLAEIARSGKGYAVVEVSSEGLAQHRHKGINFDIAVFTNLTPDHIEAHGSFAAYKAAKGILFESLAGLAITEQKKKIHPHIVKTIIANLDSEHGLYYLNFKADKHITYGIHNQTANIVASDIETSAQRSSFSVLGIYYIVPLPGLFNIYNVLAAISVASSLDFKAEDIAKAAEQLGPIPGRMEVLQTEPFTVLIDYAHEKASMTALYDTVESWPHKRIIQVFGATGGVRDKSRRTDLGAIAGKRADIAIITDEDPFDEDPQNIIHDIANAAVAEGKVIKETLFRNPDRRGAIAKALTLAEAGDLVLITGKGAEQRIARAQGAYEPWDDRVVTKEELQKLSVAPKTH
jgi:UDP-N-acetylmuramoyl-L-alanyl-D-glutamate--2,6-diaminopimelate ligase